jgi:hypothetical protein
MLDQIAGEIDRAAPAPSPQAPQTTPTFGAVRDSEFAAPQDLAAPAPVPAARRGPVHSIDQLDEAIASDADRLLAEAQADLPPEPAPRAAPAPVAPIGAKPAPAPAPTPQPAPRQAPAPAPEPAAAPEPAPAPRAVEVVVRERPVESEPQPAGPSKLAVLAAKLAGPLRPLAELHERLGESARQTIAYCAILTMFCAACAWGMPHFIRAKDLQPVTPGQALYDDTTPAHGVRAPARSEPEPAAKSGHDAKDEHKGAEGEHGEGKQASPTRERRPADGEGRKGETRSRRGATSAPAQQPAKAESHGEE